MFNETLIVVAFVRMGNNQRSKFGSSKTPNVFFVSILMIFEV